MVRIGDSAQFEKAAQVQRVEKHYRDPFHFGGGCERQFFFQARSLRVANQLVEADRDGLAEVHGDIRINGGHAHQPVAMAQIVIREAKFFGAEQERNRIRSESLANQASAIFQATQRLMQRAMADGGGPYHERAIGDGFGDGLELFGAGEQFGGAHSRTRLAKRWLVRVHHTQLAETEIAHGAGGRANVERITR